MSDLHKYILTTNDLLLDVSGANINYNTYCEEGYQARLGVNIEITDSFTTETLNLIYDEIFLTFDRISQLIYSLAEYEDLDFIRVKLYNDNKLKKVDVVDDDLFVEDNIISENDIKELYFKKNSDYVLVANRDGKGFWRVLLPSKQIKSNKAKNNTNKKLIN